VPLIGVNAPREVVRMARSKGFEAFDAEAREHLPPSIEASSAEHKQLFDSSFASDDPLHGAIPEPQREAMRRAQLTWDAAMGWNAMQALESCGSDNTIMVVLLGSGHAAYGLGAERQIAPHFKGQIRALIPVRVRDEKANAVRTVQASYADFVWGVPPAIGPEYPVLGVSLAGVLGSRPSKVIQVEKGSSAEQAGLRVGDILLRLGGTEISSSATLQRALSGVQWGDSVMLEIRRDDEVKQVPVAFRRVLPEG
jgi:hypothetical protein